MPQRANADLQIPMWDEQPPTSESVSTTEAAAIAGVNERTLRRWRAQGRIQATATGRIPLTELRRLGYDISDVEKRDQLTQQVQHLQQMVALLERELADAKERERLTQLEKHRLLTLLGAWQPVPAGQDTAATRPRRPRKPLYLWERILDYVATSPRPRAIYEVQKALGLSKSPSRELSRLVKRQLLVRPKKGKYWVEAGGHVPPDAARVSTDAAC